jgi:galactokinase
MKQAAEVRERFRSLFGAAALRGARIYRAPGRVNLIGEHTDYNDGFVMPAAIDLYTWVVISPRDDRKIAIHSENLSETVELDLKDPKPQAKGHWSDYPRGVAVMLEREGYRLRGANIFIQSDVPIGAGLSSSAAIEVATGYALMENSGATIDRIHLAKICRRAENEFAGVRCGLMDQFISCFGQADQALMLDCRSLDYKRLPLPGDVRLVICNTMVKHDLAASEYNARREECEAGVAHLSKVISDVRALRDVTISDLERFGGDLSDKVYKRCRHVVTENNRVLSAADALGRGDLAAFGQLMRESHSSLRDDYEVSCRELDTMVELASKVEGVYGARMTGGGFGGCTINLVKADRVAEFERAVAGGYEQATGIAPEIYTRAAAGGVQAVSD